MKPELRFRVGDDVVHIFSGWSGVVTGIAEDDDGGMGQGPLVTVRITRPRPKVYADDSPVGPEWSGWKPITVTAAELEAREEAQKAVIRITAEIDPDALDAYAKELEADMVDDGVQPGPDTARELLEGWAEQLREGAESLGLGRLEITAKSRVVRW